MRAIVRTSGAVAVAAVLALTAAPAAGAADGVPPPPQDAVPRVEDDAVPLVEEGGPAQEQPPAAWEVGVTPTHVRPGETVTLTSRGCRVPRVSVDSGLFELTEFTEGRSAPAVVSLDAEPAAEHEVTFTCDGQAKAVRVTLGERDGAGLHEPARPQPGHEEGVVHPPEPLEDEGRKGVRAGFGGDFGRLGPVQLALGATLVTGSLAAAAYFAVRRRATR
ncbi:hypothetical protein [Streptomyces sp. NPDC005955]|uniref:hypothetical protein n=1 Tax=Streptomyces sp. NPDC005955 TaxID=3364738 RepID=UPI0036B589BB